MLFLWILSTILWLLNIDNILGFFIDALNPCVEGCLNLYQPEKWSELRWIIAGLIGFLTIIPLVNLQIWNFAKPGLTNSERKILRNVLVLAPVLFLLLGYISVIEVLPILYQAGHELHINYGFVVKYDAISLVYFASVILWIQVLVIVSASVMISSGITGNLDKDNANWWRLRVYGFVSLVSLLSYYERTNNGLIITLCTLLIIEIISRPWMTKMAKYRVNLENQYNHEGEIVSALKISCDCNNKQLGDYQENILQLSNLCCDKQIQGDLLRLITRYQPDNLMIFNCQNPIAFEWVSDTFPQISIEVNE